MRAYPHGHINRWQNGRDKIVSRLNFNLTDTSKKTSKFQIRIELIKLLMSPKWLYFVKTLYELKP